MSSPIPHQRIEPTESFHFKLQGVTEKNRDGLKRQDLIAALKENDRLRLMRPGDEPPGKKLIGVCTSTGHQLGFIQGEVAEEVARALEPDEWIEVLVAQVTQGEKRFARKAELGLNISVRRYKGQVLPAEAVAEHRFRSARYEYDPAKESDGRLLERIGRDMGALGPAPANASEKHFRFHELLKHYYAHKDHDPDALHLAIITAQMQIAIAEDVKKEMKKGKFKGKPLPRHSGFELLAIIREKQGLYDHAIHLSHQAEEQGWFHDWRARIERCERKKLKRDG